MAYFIKQINEQDCGITALKILLANIYHNEDYLFYPENDLAKSLSLNEIILIAKREGIKLAGYKFLNKDEIKTLKKKYCLIVLKEGKYYHLVYLKKVKRKGAIILDPKRGKTYLSFEELFDKWNGEYLEVIEINKKKEKFKKMKILPTSYHFIINFFQILSSLFFMSGLYFINKEISYLIPLLFFTLFILTTILFNLIITICMKNVDKKLFLGIYETKGNLKDKYINITKLKSYLFKNPIELISSSIFIIFTIFLFGINNYLNLIAIFIILLIDTLFHIFSSSYFTYKKMKIENYENFLFSSSTSDAPNAFKALNDEVYKFISLKNIKMYIVIFLIIVLSLTISGFENKISLNYILFDTFGFYYIVKNFENILNYKNNKNELNYYKNYYYYISNNY